MGLPLDIKEIDDHIDKKWIMILEDIEKYDEKEMNDMRDIQKTVQSMVDAASQYNVVIVLGHQTQQIAWQIMNKYDKHLLKNST